MKQKLRRAACLSAIVTFFAAAFFFWSYSKEEAVAAVWASEAVDRSMKLPSLCSSFPVSGKEISELALKLICESEQADRAKAESYAADMVSRRLRLAESKAIALQCMMLALPLHMFLWICGVFVAHGLPGLRGEASFLKALGRSSG